MRNSRQTENYLHTSTYPFLQTPLHLSSFERCRQIKTLRKRTMAHVFIYDKNKETVFTSEIVFYPHIVRLGNRETNKPGKLKILLK